MTTTLDPSAVATMQGRELDAAVAVRLFGWAWFRCKIGSRLCTLQPPESDGWSRSPWGPDAYDLVQSTPPDEDRFRDWDRGGCLRLGNGMSQYGLPHFSSATVAFFAMVEKVRENGWWPTIELTARENWTVNLSHLGETLDKCLGDVEADGDTLPLAFARAALLTTIPANSGHAAPEGR